MMIVADASVSIKWFLNDDESEEDSDKAIALLQQVGAGAIELVQPPHWLPEVIAVITRLRPQIAEQAIDYLTALEIKIDHDTEVLKLAAVLSRQLNHHLFDTYYHALAIAHEGVFVTADTEYFKKTGELGKTTLLNDWVI